MTRWYRAYEGTVTDAKLGEVALVAKCSRSVAIAAWHAILESAATVNDGGRFDVTARRVAVILCEPVEIIDAVFSEMQQIGMISGSCVAAWARRQFESDSSTERSRRHRERAKASDATLQERSATPPYTDTETDISVLKEPHKTRERANDDWPADYRDQFWRAYPHRVGKSTALAKLDRIRKAGGVTFARLMDGLRAYIASKPPDRQWCNPATWLNQGRWDDEPSIDDGKPVFSGQRASGAPRPDPVVSAMVAMCNRGARSPTAEPPFDPFSPRPDGGTAGDGWPDDRSIDLAPVAGGRSGNHAGGGGGPSLFAIQGGGRWGGSR